MRAGTYDPDTLEGMNDLLWTGVMDVDAERCLIFLPDQGDTHAVVMPRGATVTKEGTLQVPEEALERPVGVDLDEGPVEYRLGEQASGGALILTLDAARDGQHDTVLPSGCYADADVPVMLWSP
ncbi:MAG: hypothetical protein Q4G34_04135 [Micrococcus sp.]|nr:hypothetical protein [Micrococcus sp.]